MTDGALGMEDGALVVEEIRQWRERGMVEMDRNGIDPASLHSFTVRTLMGDLLAHIDTLTRTARRLRDVGAKVVEASCIEACEEYENWHAASCPKAQAEGELYVLLASPDVQALGR